MTWRNFAVQYVEPGKVAQFCIPIVSKIIKKSATNALVSFMFQVIYFFILHTKEVYHEKRCGQYQS